MIKEFFSHYNIQPGQEHSRGGIMISLQSRNTIMNINTDNLQQGDAKSLYFNHILTAFSKSTVVVYGGKITKTFNVRILMDLSVCARVNHICFYFLFTFWEKVKWSRLLGWQDNISGTLILSYNCFTHLRCVNFLLQVACQSYTEWVIEESGMS